MINTQATYLKGIPNPYRAEEKSDASIKAMNLGPAPEIEVEEDRKIDLPTIEDTQVYTLTSGQQIHGHLASDSQHPLFASSKYPLRTFVQAGDGKAVAVNSQEFLAAMGTKRYPSKTFTVEQSSIESAIDSTSKSRQQQLDSRQMQKSGRAVPKDATLNPVDYSMFVKNTGDVSATFAAQLSDIGKIEGFQVCAGVTNDSIKKFMDQRGADNISYLQVPHGEVWTEDYGEPIAGGGRVVPAIFTDHYGELIRSAIKEGRDERFGPMGLDGNFAYHGAVNQGHFQELCLAQGIAENGPVRQAISYLEGGNIYTGSRPDGSGYVLVGKDSFQVTKKLLEKQTGKSWSDAQIKEAIAADMGIEPSGVVPIEQPGAFHLDMRLTSTAPGEILLSDSVMAVEQEVAWMQSDLDAQAASLKPKELKRRREELKEQAEQMLAQAKEMKKYEDLTAKDLVEAGFVVNRVGGSFVDPTSPKRDTANYFNARHGTNEEGQRFTILMGGTPREEAYMAQQVFDKSHGEISHIYFLDPKVTQSTLDLMGGLKCRTKPGGDLVSHELLSHPAVDHLVTA